MSFVVNNKRQVPAAARWYENDKGQEMAIWVHEPAEDGRLPQMVVVHFHANGKVMDDSLSTWYVWNHHWHEDADDHAAGRGYRFIEPGVTKKVRGQYHPHNVVQAALVYTQVVDGKTAADLSDPEFNRAITTLNEYRECFTPKATRDWSLWDWSLYVLASEFTARAFNVDE
jgi:hypothetical protein